MDKQKNQTKSNKRLKHTKKPTQKLNFDILKPLANLIDQATFQQNLQEFYDFVGIKQLDKSSQTYHEVRKYLTEILQYPNLSLAKLHRQSHRLGQFDKFSLQQNSSDIFFNKSQFFTLIDQIDSCPCCGLKRQNEELKICSTSFKDIQIAGISTYMFFRTLRNLLTFLLIALIVFGAFSFASNIKCSNLWNEESFLGKQIFKNTISISLGSKIYLALHEDYNDLLIWQVWLGLALVVILIFCYIWMEKVQVNQLIDVNYETKSITDYSVVIKGLPAAVTKQQLQRALDHYLKSSDGEKSVEIVKINCGSPININKEIKQHYEQRFSQLQQKISKQRKRIFSFIQELKQSPQFITPKQQRRKIIEEYQQTLKYLKGKQQQVVAKIKNLYEENTVDTLTDCFVTFNTNLEKQKLLSSISSTAFDKFFQYLTLNIYKKTIRLNLAAPNGRQQYNVKIEQASEPQDIIWQNIGMKTVNLFFRKCITFLFTFILLAMSFAVVYGLSTVQIQNQQNRYISFLISLSIVIFNFIISIVLAIFTAYQLNTTYTDYQSSYAVKAIFAQLINTILIPILVNRFLKKENYIYTTSGLAQDVFLLGLSSAFIKPLLTVLDPYYFFIKYLKVIYYDRPSKKALLNQVQFNRLYELMLFESGFQYIYLISLYLWTCFFMSLQPVIIAFSIMGIYLQYWAIKYSLFHRCKRPVPGTTILYDTMVQFVYAGGLFYSLGSLTFINFIPEDIFQTQFNFALIANLIAVGISGLSLFVPFSFLYDMVFGHQKKEILQNYEQNRIFFPSQYDRMNPATSEKSINEFLMFINQKKSELKKNQTTDTGKARKWLMILQNSCRNIYRRGFEEENPLNNLFIGENILGQLLKPKVQAIHPQSILNYLVDQVVEHEGIHLKKDNLDPNYDHSGYHSAILAQNEKGSDVRLEILNSQSRIVNQHQNIQKIMPTYEGKNDNLIKYLHDSIQYRIANMTESLHNHISYSNSPYNPQTLEQFKTLTNKIFINKLNSSKIIQGQK